MENKTKILIGIGIVAVVAMSFVTASALRKAKAAAKPKKKLKPVIEVLPLENITEAEYEAGALRPRTSAVKLVDMTVVRSPASVLGAKKIKLV